MTQNMQHATDQVVQVFTNATRLSSHNPVFVEVKNEVLCMGRNFRESTLPMTRKAMLEVQELAGLAMDVTMDEMREQGTSEDMRSLADMAKTNVSNAKDAYTNLLHELRNKCKPKAEADAANLQSRANTFKEWESDCRTTAAVGGFVAMMALGVVCPFAAVGLAAAEAGAGVVLGVGAVSGIAGATTAGVASADGNANSACAQKALSEMQLLSSLVAGIESISNELQRLMEIAQDIEQSTNTVASASGRCHRAQKSFKTMQDAAQKLNDDCSKYLRAMDRYSIDLLALA